MVRKVFDSLARPPQIREGGILVRAPYGLRKVQAALEPAYGENEVVAVDPDHLHNFVDENTAVVAAATMNPLGLNPLTQILQYFGGSESFAVREFRKVMAHISSLRQRLNLKFRTVVGGPGAAEFWYLPRDLSSLLMR